MNDKPTHDTRRLTSAHGVFFAWMTPQQTAASRGLVWAVVAAVVGVAITWAQGDGYSVLSPAWVPVLVFVLRAAEGWLDARSVAR